ncbi:MAG: hypothetical protein AAFU03_12200, partial [Bacteroidota bacterium]
MHYKLPPVELVKLVEVKPDPFLLFGPPEDYLVVADRDTYPPIERLREPELKLAGIRLNPQTFTQHALTGIFNVRLRHVETGVERAVTGFPEGARLTNFRWSPAGGCMTCCLITGTGLQLWFIDYATLVATPLTPPDLNASLGGTPYDFFGEDAIIVKRRIPDLGEPPSEPPAGPIVQDTSGEESANRTYTNLLQSPHDEALFRYYGTSQLYYLDLNTKEMSPWAEPGIITGLDDAPGGEYYLITYVEEPFSYRVPYQKFADRIAILNRKGELVRTLAERPISDNLPPAIGAVIEGKRRFQWRSDHPAQVYWTEAQDGGDPRREVATREQLYYLEAPFTGDPIPSLQLPMRYGAIRWCRGDLAISIDWRWKDRRQVIRRWFPDDPTREPEILFDLNWEDRYNSPGSFLSIYLPNDHAV